MSANISVEGVSLTVPIYVQRERRARNWGSMFFGAAMDPPRREATQLLEDISFQAREGDRIAILGRNGAGKSTLLRVLNGVYQPTSGRVSVQGSCQALLNMSLGFNGEATVRENIFLRGTAMRLTGSRLREQIDPILEFAGLKEKANHRLRTLSAGQKMRLGFAISTSFQHDIILMDEWVGAGDSDFMARAKARMQDRMGGSKIVMLASHSVGLLRDVCNKGIVLERGRLVHAGDILSALQHYHELMARFRLQGEGAEGGSPIYGCADQLIFKAGALHLRGWLASADGTTPSGIVLEVAGARYHSTSLARMDRPDVARHFGLRDPCCGFLATFSIPGVDAPADLRGGLKVLGGNDPASATTPLRIAPGIAQAIEAVG